MYNDPSVYTSVRKVKERETQRVNQSKKKGSIVMEKCSVLKGV